MLVGKYRHPLPMSGGPWHRAVPFGVTIAIALTPGQGRPPPALLSVSVVAAGAGLASDNALRAKTPTQRRRGRGTVSGTRRPRAGLGQGLVHSQGWSARMGWSQR